MTLIPRVKRIICLLGLATCWACLAAPARADLLRILHEDQEAAQARVDLIQQARCEINASYYIVGDDEWPLTFLCLLRDAARRGVAVHLLVDCHDGNNQIPRALEAHLMREGVQIKEFDPPSPLRIFKHRMHDKLLIVDGEQLITGGRNIKNEYFGLDCVNYVDRDLYIRGCAAQCAQAYFVERWNSSDVHPADLGRVKRAVLKYQKHQDLNDACDEFAIQQAAWLLDRNCGCLQQCGFIRFCTGNDWSAGAVEVDRTRFMHDIPGVNKRRAGIGPDMMALLAGARQSVVLETPYMADTVEMKHLLRSLARRGVAVTIVTNSFETNDHHSTQAIYEDAKRRHLRSGIDLWEIRGCNHLHAKAAVIDGCIAVIGSYNFDELSQCENSEVAVAIYDAGVAAWLLSSIECHKQLGYEIGRNTHPVGYDTRYPGATREQLREIRVKRVIGPLIRKFESRPAGTAPTPCRRPPRSELLGHF